MQIIQQQQQKNGMDEPKFAESRHQVTTYISTIKPDQDTTTDIWYIFVLLNINMAWTILKNSHTFSY